MEIFVHRLHHLSHSNNLKNSEEIYNLSFLFHTNQTVLRIQQDLFLIFFGSQKVRNFI